MCCKATGAAEARGTRPDKTTDRPPKAAPRPRPALVGSQRPPPRCSPSGARQPTNSGRALCTAGPAPAKPSSTAPVFRASGSPNFGTSKSTVPGSKPPGRESAKSAAPSG
ncbi:hypothetical protein NDU88_005290 [Pleurodeles waltl]|uniref:Uncharacterized protein n=1 Tax=Pleurodeles waltl TaxID=8319 RepID=A0AAV7RLX5_PLEWA|nr:hypothetical protein NDU88_005290 [Pleurodeles waltl]